MKSFKNDVMYMSEDNLIRQAKKGNQFAQAQIVKKYERMIYNLGLRLLGTPDEAENILQDTFLKVLQALPTYRGESLLSTWIYRIATNEALMKLRQRQRDYAVFTSEADNNLDDYSHMNQILSATPLEELLNNELREKMNSAIELLPPKSRTIFVLKDIEGLPLKEVSKIVKMSIPAIKSNLHRTRLFLREKLAEFINGKQTE